MQCLRKPSLKLGDKIFKKKKRHRPGDFYDKTVKSSKTGALSVLGTKLCGVCLNAVRSKLQRARPLGFFLIISKFFLCICVLLSGSA